MIMACRIHTMACVVFRPLWRSCECMSLCARHWSVCDQCWVTAGYYNNLHWFSISRLTPLHHLHCWPNHCPPCRTHSNNAACILYHIIFYDLCYDIKSRLSTVPCKSAASLQPGSVELCHCVCSNPESVWGCQIFTGILNNDSRQKDPVSLKMSWLSLCMRHIVKLEKRGLKQSQIREEIHKLEAVRVSRVTIAHWTHRSQKGCILQHLPRQYVQAKLDAVHLEFTENPCRRTPKQLQSRYVTSFMITLV